MNRLPTPRDGPSMFLEGTCIAFAWDSTCLSTLKSCPRKYELSIIEGWRPKEDQVHLSFGIFYTNALEYYDQLMSRPKDNITATEVTKLKAGEEPKPLGEMYSHDEAVLEVVRGAMLATWIEGGPGTGGNVSTDMYRAPDEGHPWQYGPWDEKIGNKNRFTLIRSIIWYLDQYKDDPAKTVIDEDGNPLVERSFRMELDWGPQATAAARYDTEQGEMLQSQPYLLCGHLDRVVNYLGGVFVMDHKTTKNAIGDYYFDQFNPHSQMTQYTLAGKVILRSPIKGVIIDAAQILVGRTDFARGFTYRTQAQLEEWLGDLKYWLSAAEGFATAGYWPMNDASCFNCAFNKGDSKICAKDPAVREAFLKSHFTKDDPWNPMKPRN